MIKKKATVLKITWNSTRTRSQTEERTTRPPSPPLKYTLSLKKLVKMKALKGSDAEEVSNEYVTPNTYELEKLLTHGSVAYTHVNEVWPNVFIGNEETAKDRHKLMSLGITHVLNAAEGEWNSVDTGAGYYSGMDVHYYGLTAEDVPTFNLSQYFYSAAQHIHQTLTEPQNKLLVHCVMGRSRSATLVLAYLMIHQNMRLTDAIIHVKLRRRIIPNWGFLKQLRQLEIQLLEERKASNHTLNQC